MKTDLGVGFLHAEDMLVEGVWKQFTLTITEVIPRNTIRGGDDKIIEKEVVVFKETDKRLILGKTNARLMKFATGSGKPAEWVGKKITLYPSMGDWFGQKNVAAIRVRLAESKARPFLQSKNLGVDLTGSKQ